MGIALMSLVVLSLNEIQRHMIAPENSHIQINLLTLCTPETPKRVIGKQCRPRSDAALRRLIRVSTVCKYFNHFSLEISKSHRLTHT